MNRNFTQALVINSELKAILYGKYITIFTLTKQSFSELKSFVKTYTPIFRAFIHYVRFDSVET